MCRRRPVQDAVDAKLGAGVAEVFKEAPAAAEEHGGERDFELVHDAEVQELLNHIGATGDANVATPRALSGQRERLFRPVIHEIKGRPAGAHPGVALLIGQYVDRRMKGGLFRPGALALVEHALPHDIRADPLKRAPDEEPSHESAPFGTPVFVPGVLHGHPVRREIAIEAKRNVHKDFTHDASMLLGAKPGTRLWRTPRRLPLRGRTRLWSTPRRLPLRGRTRLWRTPRRLPLRGRTRRGSGQDHGLPADENQIRRGKNTGETIPLTTRALRGMASRHEHDGRSARKTSATGRRALLPAAVVTLDAALAALPPAARAERYDPAQMAALEIYGARRHPEDVPSSEEVQWVTATYEEVRALVREGAKTGRGLLVWVS
ncbi:hypothetical protein OUZ56_032571 [Daphnia magna]|uniref:Uncharacterized protein n=1 Tax=Daphnia magna TaxID=35525 RepID=A0ABR0B9A2_9CRUS|nr:hypothetical protein OUZ56_032571 [Daphnia magna]